jgi:hypothetical protein
VFVVSICFFCLDPAFGWTGLAFSGTSTKKVTKKNQGKHERSARFAVPTRPYLFVLL